MAQYAIVNQSNMVTGITWWNGEGAWSPDPDTDATAQTAVLDTDPSTAQVGFVYNPADGSFTDPNAQPVTVSSPGLISRILSALNPFK